ncbi:acyltransferase [Kineosporia succinea]|uniref:Acetyltransferase-like isoleucine patch superfamily enzyme n=1 Tax=Kineosporia succinea TaxID=84632 RepID=A0ABT9NZ40_9ACTN|nr:acyltransferase [Kineosporia succinea]MDP9825696.1 acetyltransferase-like isoleucine patch superfamily enzyme [Kineosporia succinea]
MEQLRLDVKGDGHDLRIPENPGFKGQIKVRDNAGPCALHIADGVKGTWNINVSGGATVKIGAGSTCETALVVAQGTDVIIGEDCMFSFSVEIRTTDTHAIYDIDSGNRINPDKPILIGDHVWLGKQAIVLKGASIGSGSVAGARAIVSGKVPPLSVVAGVPARVVRSNVVWTRRIGQGRLDLDPKAMQVVEAVRATV